MDKSKSNDCSDLNFENELETFEFDESHSTQLTSRKIIGRRRRGVYGKRNSAAVIPSSRSHLQHHRSTTADEGALPESLSGDFGIQPDQLEKPVQRRGRRSNSVPFISHLDPADAFSKGAQLGVVGMTIASNTDNENAHPNLKRRESLSFSSAGSTSCFSSLSRSALLTKETSSNNFNSSSSLTPLQSFSESDNLTSSATSYMSPSSKTSMSRKRGVCESPVIHTDDLSSHGGISISRNSTSSYGSTRRARSRIFSPHSTKKMIDAERAVEQCDILLNSETPRQHHEESFNSSDTEDEDDRNTSIMRSTSTDADGNEDADDSFIHNSIELDRPPLTLKRMPFKDSAFEEGLFELPVEVNSGTGARERDQVFTNMSSYEDLKFLTRELRKWNSGKQATVFGSMKRLCTIVLPSRWGHERKMGFNRWVTAYLKFTLRSGGGNVSYLQTSQSNGQRVLKELEAAMLSYKESSKGERASPRKEASTLPPLPMSSIKISRSVSTPMMPSLKRRSSTTPSILPSIRSSLTNFRQTPMSIDKVSPHSNAIRDVVAKLDSMDITEHRNDTDMSTEPPLQRIVTLATDDNIASGRPSHDSFMNPGEYLAQMGISPRFNASESVRPAPLVFSTKIHFSAMSMMSPCVRTNPIMSLDSECVETPMPKDDFLNWGSRPIEGKDWGVSVQCDSKIIDALTVNFEDRRKNMACPTPDDEPINNDTLSKRERHNPSPFREMSLSRANSIALGFDEEADDDCCTVTTDICEEEKDEDRETQESATSRKITATSTKLNKRREQSFAKRTRMSICETSLASPRPFRLSAVHQRSSFAFCDTNARYAMDKLQTLNESAISSIAQNMSVAVNSERDDRSETVSTHKILVQVFSYLTEYDLLCSASLVSSSWADAVTDAHASLMFMSVGCSASFAYNDGEEFDELEIYDENEQDMPVDKNSAVVQSMKRSWDYLVQRFPWGMFLSEGTFKRVFKVWNSNVNAEEAISVMNIDQIDNVNVVGSELAVSVMLSSMVRRKICPNFVLVRGVFTSEYEPSPLHWGSADNKKPLGSYYDTSQLCAEPCEPSNKEKGSFQYIRMELCKHGDVEEYIKRQKGSVLPPSDSRALLFQMAFSLYVAGNKFGMKHYDVKLLNFFLDDTNDLSICADEYPYTVLRYGLGSHIFNVRMPTASAVLAKLADFGTANVRADSNGQPVLIGNFTTLENTPPDYLILGDTATQGYGHDCFGLGLCMLHLFTGHAPYEEILETVRCPPNLKKKLRSIWENHRTNGYEVIRNVIRCDVFEDDEGNIIEGEVDETLYDTLYRFLVLFGIPQEKFQWKVGCKVWRAIDSCLGIEDTKIPVRKSKRNALNESIRKEGADTAQYICDCKIFSVMSGENEHIARARNNLYRVNGGMDLLLSLVSFDPNKRSSPLDVLNSTFMETLREGNAEQELADNDFVYSYMTHSL